MNAKEFIILLAEKQLGQQILAGVNGPYEDPETLARNYSHWLVTFATCSEWTNNSLFLHEVQTLADSLLSEDLFPNKVSFHHRTKTDKDKCNGLVGQAWTIEALLSASKTLHDTKYQNTAIEVFLRHQFDEKQGLWHILEIDGEIKEIDPTFNHQLWFASSIAPLCNTNKEIKIQLTSFLDKIYENLTVLNNGLIFHPIDKNLKDFNSSSKLRILKNKFKRHNMLPSQLRRTYLPNNYEKIILSKSKGYHIFNVYAFIQFEKSLPDHSFWQTKKYRLLKKYSFTKDLHTELKNNEYAYPYNAPGFELPTIAHSEFEIKIAKKCLDTQIKEHWNSNSQAFTLKNPDATTLTARIYELCRTPVHLLEKFTISDSCLQ